jgi:hypothetical protein
MPILTKKIKKIKKISDYSKLSPGIKGIGLPKIRLALKAKKTCIHYL